MLLSANLMENCQPVRSAVAPFKLAGTIPPVLLTIHFVVEDRLSGGELAVHLLDSADFYAAHVPTSKFSFCEYHRHVAHFSLRQNVLVGDVLLP